MMVIRCVWILVGGGDLSATQEILATAQDENKGHPPVSGWRLVDDEEIVYGMTFKPKELRLQPKAPPQSPPRAKSPEDPPEDDDETQSVTDMKRQKLDDDAREAAEANLRPGEVRAPRRQKGQQKDGQP